MAENDDHPIALVQVWKEISGYFLDWSIFFFKKSLFEKRILVKPSGNLETALLRTFTYFMKPVQLWEQINMTYCSGPSIGHSQSQVAEIEKVGRNSSLFCLKELQSEWLESAFVP